jgi:hypothetical protein
MIDIGRPFNGDALEQCLDTGEFDPLWPNRNCSKNGRLSPAGVIDFEVDHPVPARNPQETALIERQSTGKWDRELEIAVAE